MKNTMKHIWFTSDTHFGSERTLEFSKRPFETVTEMDDTIISNWNECVAPNDTVYHLGDFGDYDRINDLNGHIHLILGNYELNDIDNGIITLERLRQMGFIVTSNLKCNLAVYHNSSEIETLPLTHKPEDCDKTKFNLFGHIHGLQKVKRYGLNVGVDCHYFKPINLEEVLWWKNAIENHYDNNVFD